MSQSLKTTNSLTNFFSVLWQAIIGKETDFTTISIRKAIVLLAIPMMLEMIMESVFALVDLYFVGHLPNSRICTHYYLFFSNWHEHGCNCSCCP
jgi:Na+-driven multidrug efflux pump